MPPDVFVGRNRRLFFVQIICGNFIQVVFKSIFDPVIGYGLGVYCSATCSVQLLFAIKFNKHYYLYGSFVDCSPIIRFGKKFGNTCFYIGYQRSSLLLEVVRAPVQVFFMCTAKVFPIGIVTVF